jgi:putative colanic acid biosynthesis acetyltransferase WcaF
LCILYGKMSIETGAGVRLRANGFSDVADAIDRIMAGRRGSGTRTRRDWWGALAGTLKGKPTRAYGLSPNVAEVGARSELPPAEGAIERQESQWTFREKVQRLAWGAVEGTVFRFSPHNAYGWRSFLVSLFGAKLGKEVRLRRTAHIEIPWNLTMGDGVVVGDFAIVYCVGPVTIGRYSMISQYAHLCAGSHETTTRRMELLRTPITIGDEVWVAADAFVGPGVTIGDRTILGARASAFQDLPPDIVAVGNPAKPIKKRVMTAPDEPNH